MATLFPQQAIVEAARLLNQARAEAAQGRLEQAIAACRAAIALQPGDVQAMLMLGTTLMQAGQPREAEALLRPALAGQNDPIILASLHNGLAWALRRQNNNGEALEHFAAAGRLDPAIPFVDAQRAEILQTLERNDEAVAVLRQALAREPENPHLHRFYNDLLYRLERRDEYLKSYDHAPRSRELLLGKARFLAQENRAAEAHALYAELRARDGGDAAAATGVARMLAAMGRLEEAGAAFEAVLVRHGDEPGLCAAAAEIALSRGEPHQAVALCQRGLRLEPYNQLCVAGISVALRLMEDERDELLGGYDTLIRVFDLEAPQGFSDMASFNAELDAALGRSHPRTREYVGQSLRGGTQTAGQLFDAGHGLVRRLQVRIDEALARYIAELPQDDVHPFLSRRGTGFRHVGSWSSRLRDSGFHVNHIHPEGWISSCYYVGVPGAVKDQTARQGWIKFGEPSFAAALKNPIRRAIQPVPGRLVLFPSYTWHGTVPFHDARARTTIAFDAVPL